MRRLRGLIWISSLVVLIAVLAASVLPGCAPEPGIPSTVQTVAREMQLTQDEYNTVRVHEFSSVGWVCFTYREAMFCGKKY